MRAWTVDADDIRVAEDFDDALLHHTPEIDSFLNLDRDDKFIVIGTKRWPSSPTRPCPGRSSGSRPSRRRRSSISAGSTISG